MSNLEKILNEGFKKIDQAVSDVFYKWDCTPWGNGLTDDAEILQRILDRDGVLALESKVYRISKSLLLQEGRRVCGEGAGKTAIIWRA